MFYCGPIFWQLHGCRSIGSVSDLFFDSLISLLYLSAILSVKPKAEKATPRTTSSRLPDKRFELPRCLGFFKGVSGKHPFGRVPPCILIMTFLDERSCKNILTHNVTLVLLKSFFLC